MKTTLIIGIGRRDYYITAPSKKIACEWANELSKGVFDLRGVEYRKANKDEIPFYNGNFFRSDIPALIDCKSCKVY